MRRQPSKPRPDFAQWAGRLGFDFATIDGEPYWDEKTCYVFSMREIEDDLEGATAELCALSLELVARAAASEHMMARLKIPSHARDVVARSWRRRDPSLYGRFDFAYDGAGPPKLLEYNADTPTSLFESAVVQWVWLEELIARGDLPQDADQFNSLHDKLVARWRFVADGRFLHLACMTESIEDAGTTAYLEACAREAGLNSMTIDMTDIGVANNAGFVDRDGGGIELLFKLYPWEWMFSDPFGKSPAIAGARFVEPAWKMILSNKGMLALLWEMAPGHPNLLPCYFESDWRAATLGDRYARKPLLSREGADIALVDGEVSISGPPGGYGAEGFVRQALHLLPNFDGRYPVLGCWLVGDAPAGMGVREDESPITSNRSRFVPHVILA